MSFIVKNLRRLIDRPPSNFRSIDGIRAIGVLSIILFHAAWYPGLYVSSASYKDFLNHKLITLSLRGHFSVDAFFVISGFLITYLLFKEHQSSGTIDLKQYYWRRALRIFPAYFLVLCVNALFFEPHCQNIWANFLQINNFLPLGKQCMLWSWSLAIECQFYLLSPFLVLFLIGTKKFRPAIFISVLILWILICAYVVTHYQLHLYYSPHLVLSNKVVRFYNRYYEKTYTRFGAIFFGVIVAFLYCDAPAFRKWMQTKTFLWGGLAVAAWSFWYAIFSSAVTDPHIPPVFFILSRPVFSLGVSVLVLLMFATSHKISVAIERFFSHILWYPVAQLSYSMFLIHPIIITHSYGTRFLMPPASISTFLIQSIFFICSSFLLALPMYVFIERPFMDMRK